MSGALLAGVDVGGSKIAVLVADGSLRAVGRHTRETGVGDEAYAVDVIAGAIDHALADAGRTRSDLLAHIQMWRADPLPLKLSTQVTIKF